MAKQWYFLKGQQQYGPISALELKQKADSGDLGPDDPVRPEDRQNWVQASTVKGLFAAPSPPPPSVPSMPPPPPTAPLPPPLPTALPVSPPNAVTTGDGPKQQVRPFGEWYRATWLSQKSGRTQILVWAACGFAWIPYWYFWTATPSGSLRGKWESLGLVGRIKFATLTIIIGLLVVSSVARRADQSGSISFQGVPSASRRQSGTQSSTAASSRAASTGTIYDFSKDDYTYDFSKDNQSIPAGAKVKTWGNKLTEVGVTQATDLRVKTTDEDNIGKYVEESGYITVDNKWLRHGQRTLWYDDNKTAKYQDEQYLHGKLHGKATTWSENGQQLYEGTFVQGMVRGNTNGWYKTGEHKFSKWWLDDKKHGEHVTWYQNGKMESQATYVNNVLHGRSQSWYDNGQQEFDVWFLNGKRHGHGTWWDERGRKTQDEEYSQDERVGVWTFGYGRMNKPDEFYYVRVSTGPWTGGSRAQFIVRLSLISSACKHFAREGFFQGNFDSDEAFFEVFGRPDRVFPDPESQNFHIWRYDRCSDGPILLHSSWVEKGIPFQLRTYSP